MLGMNLFSRKKQEAKFEQPNVFDVENLLLDGRKKPMGLQLSNDGMALTTHRKVKAQYSADKILGVFQNQDNPRKMVISVVHEYVIEVDAEQVSRIQDTMRSLSLCQNFDRQSLDVVIDARSQRTDQSLLQSKELDISHDCNTQEEPIEFGAAMGKSRGSKTFSVLPNILQESTRTKSEPSLPPDSTATQNRQNMNSEAVKFNGFAVDLTIDMFEFVKPLGRGGFGEVFLAVHKNTQMNCALKSINKERRGVDVTSLWNERNILIRLSHPYVVQFYGSFQTPTQFFLCMEYIEGGDMFQYIRKEGRLNIRKATFYIAEVVLALDYLHQNNIIYRDLKPENLLMDAEGHIKLADFGLAKIGVSSVGASGEGTNTFCGTPHYLAPEVLNGHEYGLAVDWWSLGVLMFEMLTGAVPFHAETRMAMYELIQSAEVRYPANIAPDAQDFIRALLIRRPEERLGSGPFGVTEIKNHKLFRSIDWDKLAQRKLKAPSQLLEQDSNLQSIPQEEYLKDASDANKMFPETEDAIPISVKNIIKDTDNVQESKATNSTLADEINSILGTSNSSRGRRRNQSNALPLENIG